jgi:HEAT repeat protein
MDRREADTESLLTAGQPGQRREAARLLGSRQGAERQPAAIVLCQRLGLEPEPDVRSAIFAALARLGGPVVIDCMLSLLGSEDAGLRNGAIDVLAAFPEDVAPFVSTLLRSPNADVRILMLNTLGVLQHPSVPVLLRGLLERETEPNVVGTAIDVINELGDPGWVPMLETLRTRFAGDPFIQFACEMAIEGMAQA